MNNLLCRSRILSLAIAATLAIAADARSATLTWDSDPGTAGPQDGGGNWTTNTANWWNGSTDIAWTNANGDSAIFGVPNAAGGTVNLPATSPAIVVANITFNTNYTLGNSSGFLALTNSPTITAAAGTTNTIIPVVTGSGFTKDGPGTVVLNPSANNTYSGLTTVNNGVLQVGGNDSRIYVNGDLLVNPLGSFKFTSGGAAGGTIPLTSTV